MPDMVDTSEKKKPDWKQQGSGLDVEDRCDAAVLMT